MRKLIGCLLAIGCIASCGNSSELDATGSKSQPQSAAAQSVQLRTDSEGLAPTVTSKGMMVKLDGRFESAVMMRRNADGTLTTECHDDQEGAEAFVQGAAATATHLEVK